MINYAIDDGTNTSKLLLENITQPVLQDTMQLVQGANTPAITVSNSIESRALVLVAPDKSIYRRSSCGQAEEPGDYELDLQTQAGKDTLLGWINAILSED